MNEDVLMRFGLADSPTTGPALSKLATSVRNTMQEVSGAVDRVGSQSVATIERITDSVTTARREVATFSGPQPTQQPVSYSQLSTGTAPPKTFASDYGDQLGRLGGASGQRGRMPVSDDIKNEARDDARTYGKEFHDVLSQMTGLSDDDMTQLVGGSDERFKQLGKERGEAARKGIRDAMSQSLGLDQKTSDELFGTKPKQPTSNMPDGDIEEIAYSFQQYSKLADENERINNKLGKGFREFAMRSGEAAEGLGRITSGLTYLSAKNKDLQVVIDTILTIKGVTDVFVGFSKTISNSIQLVSLYGERQQLAAKKQQNAVEQQELATIAVKEYTAILAKEGISIEEAARGNKELAQMLERVSASAEKATQSTKELVSEQKKVRSSVPAVRTNATGAARVGRAGGIGSSVASVVGSEGIAATVGTGIAGLLANIGLDAIIEKAFSSFGKRAAAGAAGAAGSAAASAAGGVAGTAAVGAGGAAAGAGGAVAGGSLAALATTAGAAAAALGAIGLVGYQLTETFRGTATKAGSLTDRIASLEVGFVDWVRDLLGSSKGGFDLVGGSEQARKADKALEERRKMAPEREIQRATASEVQDIGIRSEAQSFQRRISDMDAMRGINSQTGADRLSSLSLQSSNLGADIEGEKRVAELLKGDKTTGGQQKLAEAMERIQQLERQKSNVDMDIRGTKAAGGVSAKDQLDEKNLAVQREFADAQQKIADLSADETKNAEALAAQRQRSVELAGQLSGIEQEQLGLIRTRAEEEKRANEQGIAAMTQRLSLVKQEGQTAKDTLKSSAMRFAQMSMGDQFAVMEAKRKADAGLELTDKDRSLLRSVGTSREVAAADKADMAEAEKLGFSKYFGQEERQVVAEAAKQEQQLKVEIANKEAIQVQIDLDYQRMAKDVISTIMPVIAKAQKDWQANLQAEMLKAQSGETKAANIRYAQARSAREAS